MWGMSRKSAGMVTCRGCGAEFWPYPMSGKFCRDCKRNQKTAKMTASAEKRKAARVGKYPNRGKVWEAAKDQKRLINHIGKCEVCGLPEKEKLKKYKDTLHYDHIVLLRIAITVPGANADDPVNQMELCNKCHAVKKSAESYLAKGDILSFTSILKRFNWPMDRVFVAMKMFRLG